MKLFYSVSRKKDPNAFSNSFYETQAILMKFGRSFPE